MLYELLEESSPVQFRAWLKTFVEKKDMGYEGKISILFNILETCRKNIDYENKNITENYMSFGKAVMAGKSIYQIAEENGDEELLERVKIVQKELEEEHTKLEAILTEEKESFLENFDFNSILKQEKTESNKNTDFLYI